MENFEKIELLLRTKTYAELSKEELDLVSAQLSKESYEELRQGIQGLRNEKVKVRRNVKRSLVEEMKHKPSFGLLSILNTRVPAYAMVVPLIFLGFMFLRTEPEPIIPEDRIVEVVVRDTIQITKVDTVLVDRIIRVSEKIYITQKVEETGRPEQKLISKTSMSDQSDILDLVIRGE